MVWTIVASDYARGDQFTGRQALAAKAITRPGVLYIFAFTCLLGYGEWGFVLDAKEKETNDERGSKYRNRRQTLPG